MITSNANTIEKLTTDSLAKDKGAKKPINIRVRLSDRTLWARFKYLAYLMEVSSEDLVGRVIAQFVAEKAQEGIRKEKVTTQ